jgi:signal transduction histidine kinase
VRLASERAARLGDHVRFAVDAPDTLPMRCDPERLDQLLDNLLENAVKYNPGGGEVAVTLTRDASPPIPLHGSYAPAVNGPAARPSAALPTAPHGAVAHLTVRDRGIGIPTAELPRIFDRFHRASNVDDRRFSGMGLGLYMCRQIAEQHGGTIWAESPGPGQGSTFHVLLPLEPSVNTESATDQSQPTTISRLTRD